MYDFWMFELLKVLFLDISSDICLSSFFTLAMEMTSVFEIETPIMSEATHSKVIYTLYVSVLIFQTYFCLNLRRHYLQCSLKQNVWAYDQQNLWNAFNRELFENLFSFCVFTKTFNNAAKSRFIPMFSDPNSKRNQLTIRIVCRRLVIVA